MRPRSARSAPSRAPAARCSAPARRCASASLCSAIPYSHAAAFPRAGSKRPRATSAAANVSASGRRRAPRRACGARRTRAARDVAAIGPRRPAARLASSPRAAVESRIYVAPSQRRAACASPRRLARPAPRWRRKRWNSRASTSPDGSCDGSGAPSSSSAARSRLLDERLHVGIHLDGARDLALVLDRGVLELGGVDGDADEALEPAQERQRALRVRDDRDVVRHRGPQRRARHAGVRARVVQHADDPGRPLVGRRRRGSSRSTSASSDANAVTLTGRECGTSASSAPSVTTICTPSASASSITVSQNVRQR